MPSKIQHAVPEKIALRNIQARPGQVRYTLLHFVDFDMTVSVGVCYLPAALEPSSNARQVAVLLHLAPHSAIVPFATSRVVQFEGMG